MALNRYSSTKKDSMDRYKTTRMPNIPVQPTDLYIISREGDRLDLLSNEFYEDPRYWWVLSEANPGLGKGTFIIPAGLQIRIPQPLSDITNALRRAEEER